MKTPTPFSERHCRSSNVTNSTGWDGFRAWMNPSPFDRAKPSAVRVRQTKSSASTSGLTGVRRGIIGPKLWASVRSPKVRSISSRWVSNRSLAFWMLCSATTGASRLSSSSSFIPVAHLPNIANLLSSSSTHWGPRMLGQRTSVRETRRRIISSLSTKPALIVLPSPTSSARSYWQSSTERHQILYLVTERLQFVLPVYR